MQIPTIDQLSELDKKKLSKLRDFLYKYIDEINKTISEKPIE